MKTLWMQTSWIFLAIGMVSFLAAEDAPKPIKISLIGDSTVATYTKRPEDRPDLTGWGQVFGEQFTDRVTVLNHAMSGRSSKSFRRENRWQPVLDAKPDYVFIQFGHNDQKKEGDRYADPETDFRDQMKQYIAETRAIGATPVLVTPVARRTFADGKATTTLTPYADAMHAVGKETKTPVIDLHKVSLALYDKLGDEASADLTFGNADRTHFTHKGAVTMAEFVADGVREQIPELRVYLKQKP
ncbi:MAG TPA: rhamnogalacturonan acetylesterase [Planctomycetaceae bacterium]|nr:rhamnogalacturonan acetylesterase [Planctomycetaceae bacterium]